MSTNIAGETAKAAAVNATRTFPLTSFHGEKPAAPAWFHASLDAPHDDRVIEVEGARLHSRSWGEKGKPGLILIHGGLAHLSWWDFIAPFLARDHHVVATSLSGMGGSDQRDAYAVTQHGREALGAAEDWGLFECGTRPIVISHSYGGFVTLAQSAAQGARLGGAVIMDTPIKPPSGDNSPASTRGARSYDTLAEALARFRLLPDQDCENLFLVDHVARHAVREFEDAESGRSRYRWGHDPALWKKLQRVEGNPLDLIANVQCPLAFIRGTQSALVTDEVWALMREFFGPDVPMIDVPEARHHLMLDQPLATIAALNGLLACWPTKSA
jgi:pimeloyl-ACP methyl ester carboxylesterase